MKLIGISTCINDGLPGLFWMDAQSFILGLAFIFPAYVSNATPVVVVRFLARRHPIDLGVCSSTVGGCWVMGRPLKAFSQGQRRGFLTGALIHLYTPWLVSLTQALLLSIGALLGDIAGAFIKRRLGISQGGPAPILDQLGFLVAPSPSHTFSPKSPMARRIHTSRPNAFHCPHARRNKHSRIPTRAKRQMVLKMGPWVQHVHGTGFHRG
jgi:CDP-2,3-bis-(O-geranylgeranyl)-sn-glycerol synthase